VPELSVLDQIRKLVELQKIDGEIFNLKKEAKEKPAAVEVIKNEFEEQKAKLYELKEKAQVIQVRRKEQELELKSKEEEMSKANVQLLQLKTNKEYTAKLAEIENIKADKSIFEEKILLSFDESDAISAEMEKEKAKVAEAEKNYQAKTKELEDDVKLIEDRIKVLESQRKQVIPDIDQNNLKRYERILEHKEGMAIVPVQGNSCGGCYMNVTSQMVNAIKLRSSLVECEMCSRILYFEDDL
jgi:uncharacterized protein